RLCAWVVVLCGGGGTEVGGSRSPGPQASELPDRLLSVTRPPFPCAIRFATAGKGGGGASWVTSLPRASLVEISYLIRLRRNVATRFVSAAPHTPHVGRRRPSDADG